MYKKSLLYVGSTVGSKNKSINQFYSLGWNKLILHHKNGGWGRICKRLQNSILFYYIFPHRIPPSTLAVFLPSIVKV